MVALLRVQLMMVVGMSGLLAATTEQSCVGEEPLIGPLVGHTEETETRIWARLPQEGEYVIEVVEDGGTPLRIEARATAENDLCVTWRVAGLKPASRYRYRLLQEAEVLAGGESYHFTTTPQANQPAKVRIGFGSCCAQQAGDLAVWNRVGAVGVDGFVLLGDTPYIDSTNLDVQRQRYRAFSRPPDFQGLFRHIPLWGTWDDHDFGKNDSDGTLAGKENSLRAFTEYRPNAEFGHGSEGIYTRFRYGPVEVFLLDTRWWSWTGPSYADASKKTLLGKEQWEWLQRSLMASDAPFRLLVCGMIWDDKKNSEKDDWETYAHERQALFEFIGREKIPGVVLIGGDIHVSRVLKYSTLDTVGYPLYQFITSPIHNRVIPSLNVPHPALIRDAVRPHTFLRVTVDSTQTPATLLAEFIDKDGQKIFADVRLTASELIPCLEKDERH